MTAKAATAVVAGTQHAAERQVVVTLDNRGAAARRLFACYSANAAQNIREHVGRLVRGGGCGGVFGRDPAERIVDEHGCRRRTTIRSPDLLYAMSVAVIGE